MHRHLPLGIAIISLSLALLGFLLIDRPLAEWIHGSGLEKLPFFVNGTEWLDTFSGKNASKFLAGGVCLMVGGLTWRLHRNETIASALILTGIVHWASIISAGVLKTVFGRTRPMDLFINNDWTHLWFSGGTSFPSGHSAYYFGLFLPLATACPNPLGRIALLSVPTFIFCGRLIESAHFLSDVATSALIASLYTLAAVWGWARWETTIRALGRPSYPNS